jgi:hypothetical protein
MSAGDLIEVVRVAVIVVQDQGRPPVRGGHPPARVGLTASLLSLYLLPKPFTRTFCNELVRRQTLSSVG